MPGILPPPPIILNRAQRAEAARYTAQALAANKPPYREYRTYASLDNPMTFRVPAPINYPTPITREAAGHLAPNVTPEFLDEFYRRGGTIVIGGDRPLVDRRGRPLLGAADPRSLLRLGTTDIRFVPDASSAQGTQYFKDLLAHELTHAAQNARYGGLFKVSPLFNQEESASMVGASYPEFQGDYRYTGFMPQAIQARYGPLFRGVIRQYPYSPPGGNTYWERGR